jgi:hypothetical protein
MEAAKVPKPDVSAVYTVDLSKAALLQLAGRMHDAPGEMHPKFVELAMELTGAISAGVSLLEQTESFPVFRWHNLKGILSPFNGATTPRDYFHCRSRSHAAGACRFHRYSTEGGPIRTRTPAGA